MRKTVTLSYNGISKDYIIGNTERSCENRVEFLKGVFAKRYVIRQLINSGKLTRENFKEGNPDALILDELTLSHDDLSVFHNEVNKVVNSLSVIYNKTI